MPPQLIPYVMGSIWFTAFWLYTSRYDPRKQWALSLMSQRYPEPKKRAR